MDDPVFVCAGNACLALFPSVTSDPLPVSAHHVLAMRHFAFRLNRANFERARIELSEQYIPFRFEDHGVAHSLYLADPDGHRVELTTYELSEIRRGEDVPPTSSRSTERWRVAGSPGHACDYHAACW